MTVTHTKPLLKELNLLSLNDIYYLQLSLFAFDIFKTNNAPDLFKDYLSLAKNISERESGRTCPLDSYFLPPDLKSTYNTIRLAASAFWNIIPSDLRINQCSKQSFKHKVSKWLLSKYYRYMPHKMAGLTKRRLTFRIV